MTNLEEDAADILMPHCETDCQTPGIYDVLVPKPTHRDDYTNRDIADMLIFHKDGEYNSGT